MYLINAGFIWIVIGIIQVAVGFNKARFVTSDDDVVFHTAEISSVNGTPLATYTDKDGKTIPVKLIYVLDKKELPDG